jgi:hypothetical protein
MKYYQITKFNPQVTNAFVRLTIDQYFHEKKDGHLTIDLLRLASFAFMHLQERPFEFPKLSLKKLMSIVVNLKKNPTPNREADYALLDNWHQELKHGKSNLDGAQHPSPLDCEWAGEDPAMGCFGMLSWAKEDLKNWFEESDTGIQSAELLKNQLITLALGQLIHQNDHSYINLDDISVVAMYALHKLITAFKQHNDAKTYDAIRVLITLSQLMFKLLNGMNPRLKTNIIVSGVIQINQVSGLTTKFESN